MSLNSPLGRSPEAGRETKGLRVMSEEKGNQSHWKDISMSGKSSLFSKLREKRALLSFVTVYAAVIVFACLLALVNPFYTMSSIGLGVLAMASVTEGP